MGLNKSRGNMYEWITHTYNLVKGACYHDCSYCYMKKWGKQKPVRFDESELKTDLGSGNFIFVGSSCDMFAKDIPEEWILKTFGHCKKFDNKHLFQTKNPERLFDLKEEIPKSSVLCTTIESNKMFPDIMGNAPEPENRAWYIGRLKEYFDTYLTIEPIMDFDLKEMVEYVKWINPKQVNIGADTTNNDLPEPKPWKIYQLINELNRLTKVKKKKNLNRLL